MALSAGNGGSAGSQPVYTTTNGVVINGHLWVRSYIHQDPSGEIALVGIRCGNCGKLPGDVMADDLTVQPCTGRAD